MTGATEREGGGSWLLLVVLVVALAGAIALAPRARDVETATAPPPESVPESWELESPEDAPDVDFWTFDDLRAERDTLERQVRCLRQIAPRNGEAFVTVREGLARCGVDGETDGLGSR